MLIHFLLNIYHRKNYEINESPLKNGTVVKIIIKALILGNMLKPRRAVHYPQVLLYVGTYFITFRPYEPKLKFGTMEF